MNDKVLSFFQFMVKYTEFMDSMVEQEDKKYGALISNDIARMDKAISEQQAMLMRLEVLEKQRVEMQDNIGFKNFTFKQILDSVDPQDSDEFQVLFDRISRYTEQIQISNERSKDFVKMNLHILNMLSTDDAQGNLQKYAAASGKGHKKEEDQTGSVFQKKI